MTDYNPPLYSARCRILGCTNTEDFGCLPPKIFVCSECKEKEQEGYQTELEAEMGRLE